MKKYIWLLCFSCIAFSFRNNKNCEEFVSYPSPIVLVSPVKSKISVTGSFGELRNNHFHAGIDLRSMTGVGGDDILSAADGFISRIEIDDDDYGKSMYIEHPSGYTTLYAHLNHFRPDIEARIKTEQYKQQSFKIELNLSPSDFPVLAGEHVAYMGNTGSSKGAHLHFELRNTSTNEVLDPNDYGIPVEDHIAPILRKIKIYGFDFQGQNTFENIMHNSKLAKNYHIITVPGDILGIGVDALDRSNNSWNWIGIRFIKLFIDGALIYHFDSDKWNLNDTKFINAHIDYNSKLNAQGSFHRCFVLSGNKLPLYKIAQNDGLYYLNENVEHRVQILVGDAHENVSEIAFGVKKSSFLPKQDNTSSQFKIQHSSSFEMKDEYANFTFQPETFYKNFSCEVKKEFNGSSNAYSDWIGITPTNEPIHNYYSVSLKPKREIPAHLIEKCFVAFKRGNSYISTGGRFNGIYLESEYKQLGSFSIMLDDTPPSIIPIVYKPNMSKSKFIKFKIQDNVPALGKAKELKYNAYIDGQWILMEHDEKTHTIQHDFEDWLSSGKHDLLIQVTDDRNNMKEYKSSFTR
ncbi:MAG: M23 family metallopeptidase [Saprospiraceae bacterium]|nr:M23 family metallopeptidase [Saprospiraceae bacterium]